MSTQTEHLNRIEKLLAMSMANEMDHPDAIEMLHKVGYNSKEIGRVAKSFRVSLW